MTPSVPTACSSHENAVDLVARLQCHPQLYPQMAALLDEVENRAGALNTGDEAEEAIVWRACASSVGKRRPNGRSNGRPPCSRSAHPGCAKRVKKLCRQTTLGPIELNEQLWRGGMHTQRPFCAATCVQPRSCSLRLRRALADFGADHAFAAAAVKVQKHYGVSVPVERMRAALRYLGNRTDQLDYAHAIAHGLPVGSGSIESGHRHVIQARIEKTGAWWTQTNAHALCQLRTLRANGNWNRYRPMN